MNEATRTEIKAIIERDEITNTDDPRIEEIADRFPEEYTDDQTYGEFQMEIAEMIKE